MPAFLHLESFAPCFRDPPRGAVSVGTLQEVHLAASRGNRVQTNAYRAQVSEPFAVATVPRLAGRSLGNLSGSGRPCRHEH